jgi:hypothetical protein
MVPGPALRANHGSPLITLDHFIQAVGADMFFLTDQSDIVAISAQ